MTCPRGAWVTGVCAAALLACGQDVTERGREHGNAMPSTAGGGAGGNAVSSGASGLGGSAAAAGGAGAAGRLSQSGGAGSGGIVLRAGAGGATETSGGRAGTGAEASGADGNPQGGAAGGSGSGGSGTAGTSGAGMAGTGGVGGCSAEFCEDFESSSSFDPSRWTVATSGSNSAAITDARAAHGRRSASFHYAGTRGTWAVAHVSVPVALRKRHFGRAYVFLAPTLPNRHTVFVTAGTAGFPLATYLEVAGLGAQFQLSAVDLPNDAESYLIGGSLPTGRWFCMEWKFNDEPDRAELHVDGRSLLASAFSVSGAASNIVGGFEVFGIGLRAWGSERGDAPYDLFYDDVALDDERVGCLP